MAVRPLLLAACAWWVVCGSVPAHAWCRTHTEDPPASSCPETCPEIGEALFWGRPDPSYAFNVNLFPGLTQAQLRSMFAASFQTWENVRCSATGETVGLDISAESDLSTLQVGPMDDEPNDNVILHLGPQEWSTQTLPSKAFAITAVWFDAKSGEILGADMMFNGAMDPFGECAATGCTASDPRTDLRNVATHEIGHFLGLSHSGVEDSTMWCDAAPHEISKRSLSPDDIEGLCNIYPPGRAFLSSDASGRLDSCSVGGRPRGTSLGLVLLSLSALALWYRRRVV